MNRLSSWVWRLFPVSLVLIVLGGISARASIDFNSLDQTNAGYYGITQYSPISASFMAGGTLQDLQSVSLFLYDPGGASTGSFTISLYSSVSNHPGTLLETIATPSDSILPDGGTFGVFTYSGDYYPLAPDTQYWIVLSSSNSVLGWEGTESTSGTGVSSQ